MIIDDIFREGIGIVEEGAGQEHAMKDCIFLISICESI
jgi:hypothetical protein